DELHRPCPGRGELVWLDVADRNHDRVLERDVVIREVLRRDDLRHGQLLHRRRIDAVADRPGRRCHGTGCCCGARRFVAGWSDPSWGSPSTVAGSGRWYVRGTVAWFS